MAQILSLENVTLAVEKENSKQAIVKHVSFSINEGEIVALVGESGSGKSVTAQSIIGLNQESIHIDDGNISFQSKELTGFTRIRMESNSRERYFLYLSRPAFIFKSDDEGWKTNYRSNCAA